MKKQLRVVSLLALATMLAAPAFARDDGPRFASDRLDALVAQHAEAARRIADRHSAPAPTATSATATPQ